MFRTNLIALAGLLAAGSQAAEGRVSGPAQNPVNAAQVRTSERQRSQDEAQARITESGAVAQATGAKYFTTHQAAAAFARSISGRYHTSITRSGRLYRVDYWARGSHS